MGRLQIRGVITPLGLTTWFAAMLLLGAGLLAKHVIALPAPPASARLSSSLSAFRSSKAPNQWLAVHVLYAECRCSQRIVAHLLATARPPGWEEVVLWVGKATPAPALERAYRVKSVTGTELSGFGVEATPLLVVLDPDNHVRYAGGYTERKQGPVIDDLKILAQAQRTSTLASLPVFGCAVSDRLKRALGVLPTP
jgi:hypothetical protein